MDPKTICQKLYDHYGSDAAVGKVLGIAQSTVNRVRQGVYSPRLDNYLAMQELLRQIEAEAA